MSARPPRLPWGTRTTLLAAAVVVTALGVVLGIALWITWQDTRDEAEQRALAIARTVAADPRYAAWVQSGTPSASGPAQTAAEQIRTRTGAAYVVVTDAHGVRYAHPVPSNIGAPVSTDVASVLGGDEQTTIERGTLGLTARGKTPLKDAAGHVVGAVSVGLPIAELDALQQRLATGLIGGGVAACALGALALGWYDRRLRTTTHNLEPDEIGDLLREHAELEATRALTDALRAQNHEHANHLHALSGLLQLGETEQAASYLADLSAAPDPAEGVGDPYLRGLLLAKAAVASEHGVELRLSDDAWVPDAVAHPLDAVTVIGNLLDNATRAAASGGRRPAWVEVTLLNHGGTLHAHVVDSGDGVDPADVDRVFRRGWTTKRESDRHGVGLALARATARRTGGDVTLAAASGPDHGAAFSATLPGVASPQLQEDA